LNKIPVLYLHEKKQMEKQFLINQLLLPDDITYIIKSFCFYDINTYNIICLTRSKKKEINYMINKIMIFYRSNIHTRCQWGIVIHVLDDNIRQLYVRNSTCNNCGEYISNNTLMHPKIICHC
jgi:hypothetical protein